MDLVGTPKAAATAAHGGGDHTTHGAPKTAATAAHGGHDHTTHGAPKTNKTFTFSNMPMESKPQAWPLMLGPVTLGVSPTAAEELPKVKVSSVTLANHGWPLQWMRGYFWHERAAVITAFERGLPTLVYHGVIDTCNFHDNLVEVRLKEVAPADPAPATTAEIRPEQVLSRALDYQLQKTVTSPGYSETWILSLDTAIEQFKGYINRSYHAVLPEPDGGLSGSFVLRGYDVEMAENRQRLYLERNET